MTTSTPVSQHSPPPEGRRGRSHRPRRLRALGVLLVAVLVFAAAIYFGGRALLGALGFGGDEIADYEGAGTGEVVVQIQPGETAADVATTLREADVVASRGAFLQVANADERSRALQPGTYNLRAQMSGRAAFELLLDPASQLLTRVTVREGISVERVADVLVDQGGFDRAEVDAALDDPSALGLPDYAEGELEGFLFPATYDVQPDTTVEELLTAMIDRFEVAADDVGLEEGASELGYSVREMVTIASLIEAETPKDEDRFRVSQVVYNRLEDNDLLRFDSTVKYIFEREGEIKDRILFRDLEVDDPYNTYQNAGLPPGPINSPGQDSLEAALDPEEGPWRYFVVIDREGNSAFAETFAEHQRNVAIYQREVLGNE
jgi:UPF0755 protein